ncbi:MAG TPA: hypothetical protein VFU47_11405, partial [Armatimonadota bacterium]|nr:hypothetical protein [Armatimonadota bacterium]
HEYLKAGDAGRAVRHLEVARYLNPRKTSTLFDLARAYRATSRPEEAARADAEFRRRRALESDFASAEKHLVLDPENRALAAKLARIAGELGEPERARRYRLPVAPVQVLPGERKP